MSNALSDICHYRVIVFTRYPKPGTTKTRLIPALGADGAAEVQRSMTEWTLQTLVNFSHVLQLRPYPLTVEVCFTGGSLQQMEAWLGDEWSYAMQGDGDLGDRLNRAFHRAFEAGAITAIAIGIDCPGITVDILTQAHKQLTQADAVIGPAEDGGYYLIGLNRPIPELFEQISWGTSVVRHQTLAIAQDLGVAIAQLPLLPDIDRPEDLIVWQKITGHHDFVKSGLISVIIPVLNESAHIQKTLSRLCEAAESHVDLEIIVVDGGSTDNTCDLATNAGVRLLSTDPGRANQMNAGAAIATGEYLLFLHADTQLPKDFTHYIPVTLSHQNTIAGAFELSIQGKNPGLRWIEQGIKWRSRLFQMPYGDQAIFLRSAVFRQTGGFPRIPFMEDFEFIRQLKQYGKVAIAPAAVVTSGRRWQTLGVLQTTLLNQVIVLSYLLGVSPATLVRWYRRKNSNDR